MEFEFDIIVEDSYDKDPEKLYLHSRLIVENEGILFIQSEKAHNKIDTMIFKGEISFDKVDKSNVITLVPLKFALENAPPDFRIITNN